MEGVESNTEIMKRIFDCICLSNHMEYEIGKHTFELRGDIFILDATINDPRERILSEFRVNYQSRCISCTTNYSIMGYDFCSYCMQSSGSMMRFDISAQCDMDRREKEEQIVDEELSGHIRVTGGDEYFFTLTCIWFEFELRDEDRDDQCYKRWESEIRSLPLIHQRTIIPSS